MAGTKEILSLFSKTKHTENIPYHLKCLAHEEAKKNGEREEMASLAVNSILLGRKQTFHSCLWLQPRFGSLSLEEQKKALLRCHLVSGSCSTPQTSHLALNRAGHFHRPLLSFSNTGILLIIQCKSKRKLMCHLLAGRTEHLNVMVC